MAEYALVSIQILKRPKCSVPPHPLGVSTLLHDSYHRDMMAGGYRSHEHAVMHLFWLQFNRIRDRNLALMLIFLMSHISCQVEPVLGASNKSPRSKFSLMYLNTLEKEERADSWLKVRLVTDHYSHCFAEAGSFLCRPCPRRFAWRSLAPGGNTESLAEITEPQNG